MTCPSVHKVRPPERPPTCFLGVRTLRMGSLENECRAMALHVQDLASSGALARRSAGLKSVVPHRGYGGCQRPANSNPDDVVGLRSGRSVQKEAL